MRNSLLFKLMGAFVLVVAIGSALIAVLTSRATETAFTIYTNRSGQIWSQNLAPILAEYYLQFNSWQGVEAVLDSDLTGQISAGANGTMMGPGQGQGRGFGTGRQTAGTGMMGGVGQRLILLDDQLIVIADTGNELVGNQFTEEQAQNGSAITADGQQVGTIIVTPFDVAGTGTPAGEFLSSVNQAILSSAIIAGIFALILGAILFLQITAPLRKLKQAAAAIGKGELSRRVQINSHDEFADLGQSFNHMAENLANAETQRQHLMADVAHELRTPLTAIQGTLEAMQDRILPLDDEGLDALYSQTILLNRLINDLRLLSLAEAGQLKLDLQDVHPLDLIQKVTDGMKPLAQQKKIHLQTNIQSDLPPLALDADRMTQVLNNLISNALRYTPENGTIAVKAATDTDQNSLVITIADTGSGIDPEALPEIFNRFYRADKSRTRTSGGSGLGLAIVKQLVEAHGGKVWAKSPIYENTTQLSYGTEIGFTLPFKS